MQYEIQVNKNIEIFDIDKVAKQASGAVLMRQGKSVILATVAREEKLVEEDFLPLTVQYIEKAYAAGKIPGGYVKRETKPTDAETLTARIIDRSLRPLFPKGYTYPTQIVVMVLSVDSQTDLQVMSLNAASVALYLSDIPIKAPVCGVRIGRIDNNFILNPTNEELKKSTLDLYVSGVKDELLMIEMRALPNDEFSQNTQAMNELSEDETLKALSLAQKAILEGSSIYEKTFINHKKDNSIELKEEIEYPEIFTFLENNFYNDIKQAINQMAKSERASELNKIAEKIIKLDIAKEWDEESILNTLNKVKRNIIRSQILNEGKRADGRGLKEVRPISIETNILPNAHGSCLFTRGQTQALVVATLGGDSDAQMIDLLNEKNPVSERFMVNYNFPGFSVGEASPIKAPSRRELGHGNLGKRALYPSIPQDYPYVIRLVSEILESNGSSSMATVCGGSLALRAAGVPSLDLIAGVAMGLIFENDQFAVLTDIMGLEDHDGDMDFKVAGNKNGITALQMDIKLGGIDQEKLKIALYQAKEGRLHILNIMEKAAKEIIVNEEILPKIELFNIEPSKIVDIIGQGGKTIKEIIEKFNVSIDLDRDKGEVKISGCNNEQIIAAKNYIINITTSHKTHKKSLKEKKIAEFEIGQEFEGVVKKITQFGAFVELKDDIDGLIHHSKIKHLDIKEQDILRVKVSEIKNGKISVDLCE
ncbi:polyribonucleotide nucleotidyltransferase [Campylobacter sp. RM10532]|uniref:polyribonucleotide nucleotidyltransferase n=1 Tax=Campylobacter TaxID=194 RepID=UPI001DDA3DDD|nr:polyribonucleotide nucleotidyltransferase [Campylobacter sp. RM10537]MBZ7929459.1 polyribonucleotide nucleotidyltransferase [Campylobacter sp. W0067]MBZ7931863.1 polyribonucleotide nucleotidyltransferase [Campylobacter sp. RM12910]MBZ7932817.1 polyribonucleotide nucleotidyltransferase [Campylobacter sp. RM10543]MBZ7933900.1 polyribonucleotide nucleotidyltransferase [Campylobacter sp. W0065]MBZ7940589.1 polyribonucleotide nucleotidyltransferase [Campylobacter sp. W0047]MBZ7944727.1 polyribo